MSKEHEHSAYRFRTDLFLSGLERIILASSPSASLFKLVKTLVDLTKSINNILPKPMPLPSPQDHTTKMIVTLRYLLGIFHI